MNPVINPVWFYLISVGENLRPFCWAVGGIVLIVLFIVGMICLMEGVVDKFTKVALKPAIISIIVMFFACLLPSEKACYQMIATTVVTPNNIEIVGETATDIVDYIIESVDTLIEKEEEDKEDN